MFLDDLICQNKEFYRGGTDVWKTRVDAKSDFTQYAVQDELQDGWSELPFPFIS